jgi:hypothetical protein
VRKVLLAIALAFVSGLVTTPQTNAQVKLLAVGNLTNSRAGSFADLSGLNNTLENNAPANLLGGLGSALTYALAILFSRSRTAVQTPFRLTRSLTTRLLTFRASTP